MYLTFIESRPSRIQYFLHYEEIIRKTWRVHLFNGSTVSLPILASLLRYGVIPSDTQVSLFFKTITKGFDLNVKEADWDVLIENGFIQQLRQSVFINHQEQGILLNTFEWANKKVDIVFYYLKNFEIDQDIVRNVANTFIASPYPFKARDALKIFFRDNPEINEKFIKIAEQNNITLPESLGFEES